VIFNLVIARSGSDEAIQTVSAPKWSCAYSITLALISTSGTKHS
jgi:hypothetical protein